MQITNTEKLLIANLKTIRSMEDQLVKALPKLAKHSTDKELKAALTDHLKVTRTQVKRIDEIEKMLNKKLAPTTDQGLKASLTQGEAVIKSIEDKTIRDMEIMGAADKTEHYEMGAYNAAITLAEKLGMVKVADLLNDSRTEEMEAAELLESMSQKGFMDQIQQVLA